MPFPIEPARHRGGSLEQGATRSWLAVSADRINRLLLSTYGEQRVITGLQDKLDVSSLVIGDQLTDEDLQFDHDGQGRFLDGRRAPGKGLPARRSVL